MASTGIKKRWTCAAITYKYQNITNRYKIPGAPIHQRSTGRQRPWNTHLIVYGDVLSDDEVQQLGERVLGGGQPGGADTPVHQLSQPRLQLRAVRRRLQVRSAQVICLGLELAWNRIAYCSNEKLMYEHVNICYLSSCVLVRVSIIWVTNKLHVNQSPSLHLSTPRSVLCPSAHLCLLPQYGCRYVGSLQSGCGPGQGCLSGVLGPRAERLLGPELGLSARHRRRGEARVPQSVLQKVLLHVVHLTRDWRQTQ